MVKFSAWNQCLNLAIDIKNQIVKDIIEKDDQLEEEAERQGKEHITHFFLKDIQKVTDAYDQIKLHRSIRDTILVDNGVSAFNIPQRPKKK
jgi:radical SAM superfamily enzyme